MGIAYVTREVAKEAIDSTESAYNDRQFDRVIQSASRSVEGILRRTCYPEVATRYFPWPQDSAAGRLWLGDHDLIALTGATSGGVTIPPADIVPGPAEFGAPYDRLDLTAASGGSWFGGSEPENANAVSGLWCGCAIVELDGGSTVEALDASETGVDSSGSPEIGVGSILRVGAERMLVTGRTMLDTGQNTAGTLSSSNADRALAVASGAAFSVGESILVESERMLVQDIAGNTLIVRRAHDGSVLAAHPSGADVYAPRTLTVVRGALGTTAAAHDAASPILVFEVPGLVAELTLALALTTLGARQAGYVRYRRLEGGDKEASVSTAEIRADALRVYGKGPRVGAV